MSLVRFFSELKRTGWLSFEASALLQSGFKLVHRFTSVFVIWNLVSNRPEQTCQFLQQDHHQQELPCHAQQPQAHHSQEQLQEGPAHGEFNQRRLFWQIYDGKPLTMFMNCVSGCSASCKRHSEEPEACRGEKEAHQGHKDSISCNTWLINKRKFVWTKHFSLESLW